MEQDYYCENFGCDKTIKPMKEPPFCKECCNERKGNIKISTMKKLLNLSRPKSPCCKKPMTSVLEMELDRLLYECTECKKEWI